ncbi:MAG TPA: DoxX family protein [Anaeromyxobacter sp.]
MALLAARVGLGIIFLMSGLGKIAGWSGTVAYAGSKGVPEVLLAGAVALEVLGGASVLLGWKTRWGVAALLVFLAPVTVLFHGFWGAQGAEVQAQMIQFLKNVSIAGGLVALGAAGAGAISVDARTARARTNAPAATRAAA